MTSIGPLIRYSGKGIFSHGEWQKEGDGLYESARILRAAWRVKRRSFFRQIKITERPSGYGRSLILLEGLPRSSVLLLGYAAEMYLKSGALRAYGHCPQALFERDLRKRFGHKLIVLAEEVEFPLTEKARDHLQLLTDFIEEDARYPITPQEGIEYTRQWNARTAAAQGDEAFREYCTLVRAIDKHVSRIDQDESNPSVFLGQKIGADGFLVQRIGGNLGPRVTYRPSTSLIEKGETAPDDIKALLDPERHDLLLHYWDESVIVEAGPKKTTVHPPKITV
ncbi:MAG: hypothetical protein M3Q19_02360 [Pseudomonadota bacterium]|nr:hypothetical protein [Pseudomonadota bacterium]